MRTSANEHLSTYVMSKSRAKRRSTCVICGCVGNTTNDHIPPKGLFGTPLPGNLLTVPACRSCNGGSSGDDEYFRNAIVMSTYRGDNRHGVSGSDAAVRSIKRSARLRQEFSRSIRLVPTVSEVGGVERWGLGFSVDSRRINRVFSRIVRGIFYEETGRILPSQWDVSVDTPESFERSEPEVKALMEKHILEPLKRVEERNFADGLFRYKFANPSPRSFACACWMVFYNKLPVICLTGDPEQTTAEG